MLTRWFNSWRPSQQITHDPLSTVTGRFVPIPITGMKLIPPVIQQIIARRRATPLTLASDKRLTIVIPFRNREPHLKQLLPPLRQVLAAQQISYQILVVEQADGQLFNRGKLLNVGVHHAWADSDYFIFHDVDMIPAHACYQCPSQPLRLITRMSYTHRDHDAFSGPYFGGTVALTKAHLEQINGLSNDYWGWGKEDDDLLFRCLMAGLVPHQDSEGLYADLDTPAPEVAIRQQVTKRGSNRALRSSVWRLQRDTFSPGLSEVNYRLLDEQRDGDLWRIKVTI